MCARLLSSSQSELMVVYCICLCIFVCVGVTCLGFSPSAIFHWGQGEYTGLYYTLQKTKEWWIWFGCLQIKKRKSSDDQITIGLNFLAAVANDQISTSVVYSIYHSSSFTSHLRYKLLFCIVERHFCAPEDESKMTMYAIFFFFLFVFPQTETFYPLWLLISYPDDLSCVVERHQLSFLLQFTVILVILLCVWMCIQLSVFLQTRPHRRLLHAGADHTLCVMWAGGYVMDHESPFLFMVVIQSSLPAAWKSHHIQFRSGFQFNLCPSMTH